MRISNPLMNIVLIISVIVIAIVVLFFIRKNRTVLPSETRITVEKAYELYNDKKNDKNFVILDVRTPVEFMTGHLENSVNIDYYSGSFQKQIERLDRKKTYMVYCRSGSRSGHTTSMMKSMGFETIYDVSGGITSWDQRKYPVIR